MEKASHQGHFRSSQPSIGDCLDVRGPRTLLPVHDNHVDVVVLQISADKILETSEK